MKHNLPYINNAKAVLITVVINIIVIFIFNFPNGINLNGVMIDTFICAFITTIINMWIVYASLKKIRSSRQMPQQVPISRLMQRLPKNPFALGFIYAIFFAVITMGINWLIITFFDLQDMSFMTWGIYKLIYTLVLSIKIVEFCIFRYVQPDWVNEMQENSNGEISNQLVKNPFPKISIFKELYGGVTGNIALNLIFGSIFGSVIIQSDAILVVLPTTIEGIPITGLIFGLIIGILVTNGIVQALKKAILTSGHSILESAENNKWFTWMPKNKVILICLTCFCVMFFSVFALPCIMYILGKSHFNFFQFSVFITVYATLISKPISYVLIKRCMQLDYIKYVLNKNTIL